MPRPFVEYSGARARPRPLTAAARPMAMVAGLALLGAACAPRHAPAPLDVADDSEPVAVVVPTPAAVEEDAVRGLEEEPLDEEAPATGLSATSEPTDNELSVQPPPLLTTIESDTAPNVAAATRLAEAGRAQMAAGDYGAALEQLERAIAVDPGNTYAYYYLAELHLIHHTYDQAIAFADRAASLSDPRAPEWASRAYTLQGNAFEAAGRFADARDAYARAIQAAPGNLAARVGLARVGSPPAAQP